MTKVLLTGGSGFIASHILQQLLEKGHSVVTTVRTDAKAKLIHDTFPDVGKDRLETVIVPDIAQVDAFDKVVQTPGIEVVLHTSSPFHFRVTDPIKDLVEPAVVGTTGILKGIYKHAPQVRRVVVTSSFAAILDADKSLDPNTVYTEKSWNPATLEGIQGNAGFGYRVSKTLAERAAWDFVRDNKPNFDLATINPPLVFGPLIYKLDSLASINTSNERFVDAITGKWKKAGAVADSGVALSHVDVRDVAKAHILAGLEVPEAGGHRLFTTEGNYSNRLLFDIIRANFPEFADVLPAEDAPGGYPPKEFYRQDNSETTKLLGIEWIKLEKTVVDTINSLKPYLK